MISIAFVLNLVALLANFAAYATPWQWVSLNAFGYELNEGYWGHCRSGKDCSWFFHDGFKTLRDAPGNSCIHVIYQSIHVYIFIIHPCDPTVVICYLIWPCDTAVRITYLISHSYSLSYNTVIKGYFRLGV